MAKEKKLKTVDDMGFDNGLDIPDFGYNTASSASDDRKPATKAAKDFARGAGNAAWNAARSDSFIRKTVSKALPAGYGSTYDMASDTAHNLKSLYDSSAREVKPLINDMKRATGKLLPATAAVLPKKVQDRIKKWADGYETDSTSNSGLEAARNDSLQATLGDIFKYQAETGAQQRAEDKAETSIQKQIDNNHANFQSGSLNSMRISLQRLADYQDKVTVNYQRKALELQYRQYFVALDTLTSQKESQAQTKLLLENIQKNTGLPDLLKVKMREDYPTLIRNKFFGTAGSMLLGDRSQFMQKLTANISNTISRNLQGFVQAGRMGIMGAEMGLDTAAMLGDDMSHAEMVGDLVGGGAANTFGGWVGNKVGGAIRRSKYARPIARLGNKLEYNVRNIPQHLTEFAHSDKGDNLGYGIGAGAQFFKQKIRETNAIGVATNRDNLANLQEPVLFNGMARKSITEIIPGYLARIYRELQVIRTGDAKTDLTTYDLTSNKFKSQTETSAGVFKTLFSDASRASTKYKGDRLLGELEKGSGQKLSPELRKAISETLMEDNINNRLGTPQRLGNISSYWNRKHADQGDKMAGVFRNYFKDDPDGLKKNHFQNLMNDMGSGMADNREMIQNLINSGYGDVLEQMGLIDPATGNINMKKMQEFNQTDSYGGIGAHAGGAVRGHAGTQYSFGSGRNKGQRIKSNTAAKLHAKVVHNHINNIVNQIQDGVEDDMHVTYGTGAKGRGQVKRTRAPAPGAGNMRFSIGASQNALIQAIEANSAKTASEKMLDVLERISKRLETGMTMNHQRGGFSEALHGGVERAKGLYQMTIGDAIGGIKSGVKTAAGLVASAPGQLWGAGKWGWDKAKPYYDRAAKLAAAAKAKTLQVASRFDDIFIPGKAEPALIAWKMRAGHYRDKATNKIIEKYSDIKGDVIDVFDHGNIVLEGKDIVYAYIKTTKQQMISTLGSVFKKTAAFGWETLGQAKAGAFSLLPRVWDMAKHAQQVGIHFLDRAVDVYVKGKSTPVLLARIMKAGGYVSTLTGNKIFRPGQIDGPVLDHSDPSNPIMALSREDLAGGLLDWEGKPIKTATQKIVDTILKPFKTIKNTLTHGFDFAKALITKPAQAIGQFFMNWFSHDGIVFSGSKTIIERLTEIRELLKDRLPKPQHIRKNSWQDLESRKSQTAATNTASGVAAPGQSWMSKLGGIGSGLASLVGRFKKKDDDEQAKESDDKHKTYLDKAIDFAKGTAENYLGDKAADIGKKTAGKAGTTAAKKAAERLAKTRLKGGFLQRSLTKLGVGEAEKAAKTGAEGIAVQQAAKHGGAQVLKAGAKNLFGKFATKAAGEAGIDAAASGGEAALAAGGETALAAGAEGTVAGLGLEMGLGSALAAGLGMTATAVAGVLASPVVLGAAALAVAGAGIYASYKGIKHMVTRGELKPLTVVRMAQYGFNGDDLDHIASVMEFEKMVMKKVTYDAKGKASLTGAKLTAAEAFEPFGIDVKNKRDVANWFQWFQGRFKPVFLSTLTAMHGVDAKASLDSIDSLDKEKKLKILGAVDMAGPYGNMATPFHTSSFLFMKWGNKLTASFNEVKAAVEAAHKVIDKEKGKGEKDKKPGFFSKMATGLLGALTGSKDAKAAEIGKDGKPIKKEDTGIMGSLSTLATSGIVGGLVAAGAAAAKWLGSEWNKISLDKNMKGASLGTKLSVFLSPTLHSMVTKTNLNPIEALRFKAYGLTDYDPDKIHALRDMEAAMGKYIKLTGSGDKSKAEFSGDPMDMLMHFGGSFDPKNVSEKSDTNASQWLEWFNRRFMPVFITFKGSYLKIAGNAGLAAEPTDEQAIILAPLIAAAKGQDGNSVWKVKASPWPKYRLNTDSDSVKDLLSFIKDKVKDKKKLKDGVTSSKKDGDAPKGWMDVVADKGKKLWSDTKDAVAGAWNKTTAAVSKVATQAWTATKDTASKAVNYVANTDAGKAVTKAVGTAASGVGDSMKGFGATLGKAYKAVTGDAKKIKDDALAALKTAGITNPTEVAMFLAQMDTESGGFKSLSENLNYSASTLMKLFGKKLTGGMQQAQQIASQGAQAVANFIYGNRMGNKDADDGFKYRGRGIIQLTGKDNYAKYGKMLGIDLVGNPDLAADSKVAAQIAVAYWKSRVSSSAAQAGDVATVTKQINGGQNGLASRQSNFQKYLQQAKSGALTPGAAATADASKDKGAAGVGTPTPTTTAATTPPAAGGGSAPAAGGAGAGSGGGSAAGGASVIPVSATGAPAKATAIPTGQADTPMGANGPTPIQSASGMAGTAGAPAPSASSDNPFAFGAGSAKPAGGGATRNIMAVQQAQHDDKMGAMSGMGDVLNKSLSVQTDSRDTLQAILKLVTSLQSTQAANAQNAQGAKPPAAGPTSATRGQPQQLVSPPVSMAKMV